MAKYWKVIKPSDHTDPVGLDSNSNWAQQSCCNFHPITRWPLSLNWDYNGNNTRQGFAQNKENIFNYVSWQTKVWHLKQFWNMLRMIFLIDGTGLWSVTTFHEVWFVVEKSFFFFKSIICVVSQVSKSRVRYVALRHSVPTYLSTYLLRFLPPGCKSVRQRGH